MFSGLSLALKKKQLAVKLTVIRYTPLVEVNQVSISLVFLGLFEDLLSKDSFAHFTSRLENKLDRTGMDSGVCQNSEASESAFAAKS